METNILERLELKMDDFSKSQRKAAAYILRDPVQAAFSTIAQISAVSGASTATIVRLANELGYARYALFQKDLQKSIQRSMAPSIRLDENVKTSSMHTNLLGEIVDIQMNNLQATMNNLDESLLHFLVNRIADASHVYVMGARSCSGVANYLAYNLKRITGKATYINPMSDNISEDLIRIGPSDIIIPISFPRYINHVITAAEIARSRGAYTICITDAQTSPLCQVCNDSIFAACKSYDFHNSTLGASMVAEILISYITMAQTNAVKTMLNESEQILKSFGVHYTL